MLRWKKAIQWENGWGGWGGYGRIFFDYNNEKSVHIRPIRSPIASAFSKAEITDILFEIFESIDSQSFIKKMRSNL